ncbi:MAG: hypothetical protein DMD85_23275 [Candidatus Rokuibacteriota bacterium]|nr:MAG: hypothetical protein DMD85_23275 [Candidatus Rokubacteria bacterium]
MPAHKLAAVLSVLLVSMTVAGARAQSSIRAVAIAGDPAPGGGTFEHFSVEALPIVAPANTKGQKVIPCRAAARFRALAATRFPR